MSDCRDPILLAVTLWHSFARGRRDRYGVRDPVDDARRETETAHHPHPVLFHVGWRARKLRPSARAPEKGRRGADPSAPDQTFIGRAFVHSEMAPFSMLESGVLPVVSPWASAPSGFDADTLEDVESPP
jgi:hypothetical protein